MRFKIGGVELDAVEDVSIGEMCEAEQQLGFSLEGAGTAGTFALMLYVALRRDDPSKPMHVTKQEVMDTNFSSIEEVEDEGPPAEGAALEDQPISGLPVSARSG